MATLSDIRRRISSVKSTQQITKAMKMVAASKLRKAQERLLNSRPYADGLEDLLFHVTAQVDRDLHPLLAEREATNVGYVVVSADRGLCGSFNSNVIRQTKTEIAGQEGDSQAHLLTVGRKAFEHFSRRDYTIREKYIGVFDDLQFSKASRIGHQVHDLYLHEELDRVFLIYNSFKSPAVQVVRVQQILPIQAKMPEREKYQPVEYLYQPSPEVILSQLCPKYLSIQLWRALLESYASEHGARMVAMEAATDSAQDMIHDLTLYYNKVRQASITTEISEIVGGAEALRG